MNENRKKLEHSLRGAFINEKQRAARIEDYLSDIELGRRTAEELIVINNAIHDRPVALLRGMMQALCGGLNVKDR